MVSGGHTSLFEVAAEGEYHLLGRTRDDAAGEAFDKVAKLLGLGYPGGPLVDRLARGANDAAVEFKVAKMSDGRPDFSFSGLKTAVLYHVRQTGIPPVADPANVPAEVRDLLASFQRAVVTALLRGLDPRGEGTAAEEPPPHRRRGRQLAPPRRTLRARRRSWACPSSCRPSTSPPTTPP